MPLNGIIWIRMQHSRSWNMIVLDTLLTVINLIYKNLFYHQPFLMVYQYYKVIRKKRNASLDNIVTKKDIKFIN